MSFQTAISFTDATNLLIVWIHLYLLRLIRLEWWSRIGSGVRRRGPAGEGEGCPLLLPGGRVGREGKAEESLEKHTSRLLNTALKGRPGSNSEPGVIK